MFLCILVLISHPFQSILNSGIQGIPIDVIDTWEIDYASDIQDIAFMCNTNNLAIRSNGDGKIYLADDQCNYLGEIALPDSVEGFGLTYDSWEEVFYINCLSDQIYYLDGSDSWASFPHTYYGAGMDFAEWLDPTSIFEVSPFNPHTLCSTNIYSHEIEYCNLSGTGVDDELSGLTVGMMCTSDYWPCALIATTRSNREFLFFEQGSSGFYLLEVEDCPIPEVEESLGLTRSWECTEIYWSYKGNDGNYYISLLYIPFFYFGGIGDEAGSVGDQSYLSIESNPAYGCASINLHLPVYDTVSLVIYDISGRAIEEIYRGPLEAGDTQWSFSASPGVYTVILRCADEVESLKFVIND
jgi:hypothetical protein